MKTETKFGETTGTMGGKSVAMSVKTEDMGAIMAILTDIYSNSLAALPREYACNAYDAHKEAGVTHPIEITTPTRFNPALQIRDYGVGMNAETIERIYANYGASTKRATDEQIGGFGIGCKSALSYTDQFTVTSVKDGFKVVVLIARDDDDSGSMQILNAPGQDELDRLEAVGTPWLGEPVSEGNGTTVSIAIRIEDHPRLESIVQNFFQYWEAGTVLVNHKAPERFVDKPNVSKIADGIYLDKLAYRENDKIIMGGVAYPPIGELYRPSSNFSSPKYGIVAFVDIGRATPHPSRETLRDTRTTKQTLHGEFDALGNLVTSGIDQQIAAGLHNFVQKKISKAKDHAEALQLMLDWAPYSPGDGSTLVYKGTTMPVPFKASTFWDPTDHYRNSRAVYLTGTDIGGFGNKSDTRAYVSIEPAMWPTTLWIKGFEPKKLTAQQKDKMMHWLENQHWYSTGVTNTSGSIRRAVLLRGTDCPSSPFIESTHIVDWVTIKAIKLPKKTLPGVVTNRPTGAYDMYTESGLHTHVSADSIRKNKPIVYIHGNRWSADGLREAVGAVHKDYSFVYLGANRITKFVRDFPKAQEVRALLLAEADTWVKNQSNEDMQALAMLNAGVSSQYYALDPTRVDDPDLKKAIALALRDIDLFAAQASQIQKRAPRVQSRFTSVKWANPLVHYPLYRRGDHVYDDLYVYLNASYKARQSARSANPATAVI